MNSRRIWTEEEDKVILQLVQEYGSKNWATIAVQLGRRLGRKPRSGKQCRQRWHNHLNPDIEKKGWTTQEQEKMFELHKLFGNKWTVIAEHLPGRTDNSIKNYFYSTIRRSLRRMGKFVGSKNSTQQMKKIKPSTLSKIFAANNQLSIDENSSIQEKGLIKYIMQNCQNVRDQIIQFTSYKPKCKDRAAEGERVVFEKVILKMIEINNIYERIKLQEKKRRNEELMFHRSYNKAILSDDSDEDVSSEEEIVQVKHTQKQKQIDRSSKVSNASKNIELQVQIAKPQNVQHKQGIFDMKQDNSMPKIIIKSQQNLENQEINDQDQNPDFYIQLKQDLNVHPSNQFNSVYRSPGFFFSTPTTVQSMNPFGFFQSPSTPKFINNPYLSSFQGITGLPNNVIDQFQISIQRQIQGNLLRQDKKYSSSRSTIGSPGSAFRFCGLP